MKKNSTGIFLILLLGAVLLTIIVCTALAKKDVEDYQEMQQTISDSQQEVDKMDDALQHVTDQIEDGYDKLDSAIGE